MSHPLDVAIAELELEVTALGAPDPATVGWFTLRAKSTGLTMLRVLKQRGLQDDPAAAENFRKNARKVIVKDVTELVEVPLA